MGYMRRHLSHHCRYPHHIARMTIGLMMLDMCVMDMIDMIVNQWYSRTNLCYIGYMSWWLYLMSLYQLDITHSVLDLATIGRNLVYRTHIRWRQ